MSVTEIERWLRQNLNYDAAEWCLDPRPLAAEIKRVSSEEVECPACGSLSQFTAAIREPADCPALE
jgi:hypothetical protein